MPKFEGEFIAPGTSRQVYEFLIDPWCLVRCLPDLRSHEIQDRDHFSATLNLGFGPVKGPMSMRMEIAEKRENSFARIVGRGSMLRSPVNIAGSFTLSEALDGTTRVAWVGDARIGGYIMHLVGGALDRLVREHVERFVRALEAQMTGEHRSTEES